MRDEQQANWNAEANNQAECECEQAEAESELAAPMNPNEVETRLREIAERENKATKGPWEPERNPAWDEWRVVNNSVDGCRPIIECTEQPNNEYEDALFIAHSRQDVPWLLELIKKQREALECYAEGGGDIARDALNFSPETL